MEASKSLSPVPVKKTANQPLMTFPQALNEVIDGKKITRLGWENKEEYGFLKDGFLQIHTKGEFHTWTINDGDLLAIDWVVVRETN